MALLPPPKGWSFDLPGRLRLNIGDVVALYSKIVSCIIETRWVVEVKHSGTATEHKFRRKIEIAREYAHKQGKAIKEIVEIIPGAQHDAIWPAMKEFADQRDLIAHGVWMVDHTYRPIVVWHSKMLESDEFVVGEYFDYARFEHALDVGRQLLTTFSQFKDLLESALGEEQQKRLAEGAAGERTTLTGDSVG